MPDELFYPDAEDVNFERSSLDSLYSKSRINPERLEQIEREVLFSDLVADLTGKTGSEIRCPFHGTDSTPSFNIYPPARGNNGWCYGCPPGQQYWDHVRFVRELLGYSFPKAVKWIETQYHLAYIPNIVEEDPDQEVTVTVEFADLAEPYILKARREIQTNRDIEQATEFLRIYFQAEHLNSESTAVLKSQEIDDAEERYRESARLKIKAALKLARVLGKEIVDEVARAK